MVPQENAPSETSASATEEEVSTFLQLEEEAKQFSKPGRECPVPKPTGVLGDLLGLSNRSTAEQSRREGEQVDASGRRGQ